MIDEFSDRKYFQDVSTRIKYLVSHLFRVPQLYYCDNVRDNCHYVIPKYIHKGILLKRVNLARHPKDLSASSW